MPPAALTIEASEEHWIIDWSLDESEDYDRFGMEDGGGWMGWLAPLRDELLRGDLRSLYLGWLASAGEFNDDALEPEPPAGLSDLTPAQQALTEFVEIDPDLLAAAAAGSPRAAADDSAQAAAIDAWLAGWPREEMAALLNRTRSTSSWASCLGQSTHDRRCHSFECDYSSSDARTTRGSFRRQRSEWPLTQRVAAA